MQVEVVKEEKNEVDISIDNITVAEILRSYLYEQGVEFAVWRREHPSKPALLKIKSSGKTVKKAVSEAISSIKKDCAALSGMLKK